MADLKAMHAEGKFLYAGLSECTASELRRAHAVFPVSAIQMEWSIAERGVEAALVPTCAELGVGAWRGWGKRGVWVCVMMIPVRVRRVHPSPHPPPPSVPSLGTQVSSPTLR